VQCRSNETSAEAALTLSEPAAFDLREHGDLRGLDIILYGTSLAVDNIIHPGNIEFIQSVSPEQESPGRAVLHLYLDGRLAGFEGKTDGRILTVRFSRPCLTLKGARVIIDPGHGGKDSGAVGAGGLAEKDVNLKVGLRLRDLLEAKGAAVVMTRRTDTEVSATRERRSELEARVEAAAAASGAIYVSIHHNAMPDVNDGRKAHGTDIYYWRLQSAPLARAVAAPLAASVREDKARFLRRSFHVIRQTAMPAILVEVQFISNPVMEEMMKSDSYVNEAAAGILKGIENYFSEIPNPAAGSSARPADGH
jgi:N-acetylmuramoyl-L-alanine amidase